MRHFTPAIFVFCTVLVLSGGVVARGDNQALPPVLADIASFRGQLRYQARSADQPSTTIRGTLDVTPNAWSLEERSPRTDVYASNHQSWMRDGPTTLVFDDPLDVDALANSWAVLLATSAGQRIARDAGGTSWTTGTARIYLDPNQTEVIGAADTRSGGGSSFTYGDWVTEGGVRLPQSIVRMRDGVTVASFIIDSYQVDLNTGGGAVASDAHLAHPVSTVENLAPLQTTQSVVKPFSFALVFVLVAFGIVAWTRRDALIDRISHRLAHDPRAWKREGVNVFVSPEGLLHFEGRPYRVGANFYGRAALVQSSSLFIRVSAPGESRVLILARRFLPLTAAARAQRSSAGFTLIECLTASAVLTTVLVAAVFPTLVVLAHADRLAAQRQHALALANNALADEEAALAYGFTVTDESSVATVEGLKITETVAPAGVAGLHDLTIEVTDARGSSLAKVVTEVGPPVPPPGAPTSAPSAPPG